MLQRGQLCHAFFQRGALIKSLFTSAYDCNPCWDCEGYCRVPRLPVLVLSDLRALWRAQLHSQLCPHCLTVVVIIHLNILGVIRWLVVTSECLRVSWIDIGPSEAIIITAWYSNVTSTVRILCWNGFQGQRTEIGLDCSLFNLRNWDWEWSFRKNFQNTWTLKSAKRKFSWIGLYPHGWFRMR